MPQTPIILLIDDDLDDQEIFLMVLEDIDPKIKCETAMNGLHGLKIIQEDNFHPDLIFLDLNMPQMNGKDCLSELRKIPRMKDVPIYIYSTSSSEKDKKTTADLGASGFITKPNTIDELQIVLSQVIKTNKFIIKQQI